jgi:EF hand
MPNKFFTLAGLALVWVFAGVTSATLQAQQPPQIRFQAMDTNRDRIIQRMEWRGSDRAFQNQDWNGDGQLSGDEVRPGARRNTNWETADHVPNRFERYNSWTQAGFNNLDHNRDHRITSNEWHFDVETFRRVDRNRDGALDETEFLGSDNDDIRDASFDDLDWNNNGRVERSEWYGSAAAFNDLDRNRDGVLTRFEVVGGIEGNNDTWDQFTSLDYNRNGSISRDEWHWSAGNFNQRDLNKDGSLTRREFEVTAGATPTATSGQTHTVRVNSQNRWTDTGLVVRAGDTINIDASGTITMSGNARDTASPAGSTTGRKAPDAPVLNQLAGGLIAMIDNYGPIFLGGRRSFAAPVNGRLYFGVNDDYLADNRGEFVVQTAIQGGR